MIVCSQMYTYPTMTSYRTNCYSSIVFCFPLAVVTWLLYGSKGRRMDGVCVCPVCMTRTQPLWLWVNSLIMMHAVCNDQDRMKMHTHYGISFLPQTVQQAYIHHGQLQSGGSVWVHAHTYTHTYMYTPTHPRTHVHWLTPTPTHWGKIWSWSWSHRLWWCYSTTHTFTISYRCWNPPPPPPTVSKLKNQTSSAGLSLTRWMGRRVRLATM